MKTLKNCFIGALIGIGIGNLIECLLTVLYGSLVISTPQFLAAHDSLVFVRVIQTVLYAGFGIVSVVASSLFGDDGKNLFKKTTLHSIIVFAYFLATGWYLKWFSSPYEILMSTAIFIVIYALIWFAIYTSKKKEIEAVNEKLHRLQH